MDVVCSNSQFKIQFLLVVLKFVEGVLIKNKLYIKLIVIRGITIFPVNYHIKFYHYKFLSATFVRGWQLFQYIFQYK